MSKLGFFSDPHVQYVSQVIEEILSGNLQIPRFQRPYIWEWDRRLELLRSVQLGIPMGSIMIWRTTIETLKTFNRFGTVKFKEPQVTGPRQYLLDGVQRLSTLVSALTPPGDLLDEIDSETKYFVEEEDRAAFFDLESNDFVSIKLSQATSRHMPLHVLGTGVGLLRFQRGLTGPNAEKWISISDALAKAFREYKIPVIPIITDDIGLASQTFQRINSAGMQMSEKHMLHALTFSTSFDLTDALDQFRDSLDEIGWSGIDDELLLRLLKVSLQLDMYKANVDDVSTAIRRTPNLFSELKDAVTSAAWFFGEELSMPSPDLVPYAVQVIGVVEAFRIAQKHGRSVPESGLSDWVWLTTYLEYFTGLSGDKVTRQINFIRAGVSAGRIDVRHSGLPKLIAIAERRRFDYRSARSRAWMVLLAVIANYVEPGYGSKLISTFGRTAIVPGIPREKFKNPDLYFSSGNRFLVAPNELDKFRHELFKVQDETFLRLHGIGPEIVALSVGDVDSFVSQRSDQLLDLELERVSHLWNESETDIDSAAQRAIDRLRDALLTDGSKLRNIIHDAIANHLSNATWDVGDIYSNNTSRVEGEVSEVELIEYFLEIDEIALTEIDGFSDRHQINLLAIANYSASVDVAHFIWDSVDREELELARQPVVIQNSIELELILINSGIVDGDPADEWIVEINENVGSYEVDVGEVELDLGDDDEFDG